MALIRYPGSKEKLVNDLWRLFPPEMKYELFSSNAKWEYREPFFGAGAVGFRVLQKLDNQCRVWLNDFDADLVCMWSAVHKQPKELSRLVLDFTPTTNAFYDFKARDGIEDCEPVERGFRKLALHRMSVSGFGVKSGGPIGGRNQEHPEYTVGCRWTPEKIKQDIWRLNAILNRFPDLRITCGDFEHLLISGDKKVFMYLDPPYYEKGGQLYKFNMTPKDHARLATALCECESHWVLSYDDHPEIRRLYKWATFKELHITYTNAVTREGVRPKNREVAITK